MYNTGMITIQIGENEKDQRLDRFLKKYFRNAPLSYIYKMIRTSVKVNGKRSTEKLQLQLGDTLDIHISQEQLEAYRGTERVSKAKRQFHIAYEDEDLLIVDKPFGLLTHGTETEKKNTLANQVLSYLIETGSYHPSREKTFVPSPANRLDRNTTGLVLFAKNYEAIKKLNELLRKREKIQKYYLTIVLGQMNKNLHLVDRMEKDEKSNRVYVHDEAMGQGKRMETFAVPLKAGLRYSLVEVELLTGRTHQIRAQLAKAGYPIIGDEKYGNSRGNAALKQRFGLTTQLLHAYKLCFGEDMEEFPALAGKVIECPVPPAFQEIQTALIEEKNK